MRRALLIAILAFGTVAGYSWGISHLRHRWHHGHADGWDCSSGAWGPRARPESAPVPPSPPKG
jgi:hypothetical protein